MRYVFEPRLVTLKAVTLCAMALLDAVGPHTWRMRSVPASRYVTVTLAAASASVRVVVCRATDPPQDGFVAAAGAVSDAWTSFATYVVTICSVLLWLRLVRVSRVVRRPTNIAEPIA